MSRLKMASQEHVSDDSKRVIIRPSACSTSTEKRSSFGHVPHEPVKGAVVRSAVQSAGTGSSTAAHGTVRDAHGHNTGPKTSKSRLKQNDPIGTVAVSETVLGRMIMQPVEPIIRSSTKHPGNHSRSKISVPSSVCSNDQTSGSDYLQSLTTMDIQHESVSCDISSHQNMVDALIEPTVSSNVQELEVEVTNLKEQLVVQSKVNADLKKLLVASIGDDLHHKVDALVRTKIQLATEIDDYTKKLLEDYEDLDKLSIQADIWHSKYNASRMLVEQLKSDKQQLCASYNDACAAVQQLLIDRQEIHHLLSHTNKTLEALVSHTSPRDNSSVSSRPVTSEQTSVELARQSRRVVDELYVTMLGVSPSRTSLTSSTSHTSCLTHGEYLAYKMLSHSTHGGAAVCGHHTVRHNLQPRFHSCTRYEGVTFNCCRKCHGDVHLV